MRDAVLVDATNPSSNWKGMNCASWSTKTAQELYDRMLALYPHRINAGWAL